MGWKPEDAEKRRIYQREYMRNLRSWRKEHHICDTCGETDAYTLAGHRYCCQCLDKRRKTAREYIPAEPKAPKIKRGDWVKNGLCYLCGSPAGGYIIAFDTMGRKPGLCMECYRKACKALEKGRDTIGRRPAPPTVMSEHAIDTYRRLRT